MCRLIYILLLIHDFVPTQDYHSTVDTLAAKGSRRGTPATTGLSQEGRLVRKDILQLDDNGGGVRIKGFVQNEDIGAVVSIVLGTIFAQGIWNACCSVALIPPSLVFDRSIEYILSFIGWVKDDTIG